MTARKKILIADDDIHVHKVLGPVLSPEEFDVFHAHDGRETMEMIQERQPDLVVLDVMMPFVDGRDICRNIKKNPATRDIRVLMLSARDEQYDRSLGIELGADEYVTKPFYANLLATKIREMCKKIGS